MIISFIGLSGYWAFIFLRKAEKMVKWGDWRVDFHWHARHPRLHHWDRRTTHHGNPSRLPLLSLFHLVALPLGWRGDWIAVIFLFMSISLLAMGKRRGWWLAVIPSITILMINVPTQFFRTKTLDYLYGTLLAIGVLFFTTVPFFKRHLLEDETEER